MAGRKTLYKQEYDKKLIDHMGRGFSFESFAGSIGVSKQTIYDWTEANPTFLDAKAIGFEKSRMFWERVGIGMASGKGSGSHGNATAFVFNMKNRFPKEWRDKVETGITDTDGNDIEKTDLSKLTDKELRELAELQRKCRAGS